MADINDSTRFLGHVPKIELIKGDATKTIPKFIEDKPHLVVSLLFLDFDLYQPTKTALKYFYPRMDFSWEEVLRFYESNRKLFEINQHLNRNYNTNL